MLKDDTAQLVLRLPGHKVWSRSESLNRLASLTESASEYIVRESQPYLLACYFHEVKRTSECKDALDRALNSNSRGEVAATYNLNKRILIEMRQPEEAIKKVEHATELDPKAKREGGIHDAPVLAGLLPLHIGPATLQQRESHRE